jgi:hypothetical protein
MLSPDKIAAYTSAVAGCVKDQIVSVDEADLRELLACHDELASLLPHLKHVGYHAAPTPSAPPQ